MLGVVTLVGFQYLGKSAAHAGPKVPTAQELADSQFVLEKMTTNLAGSSLIQLGVTLQLDSTKSKDELALRKTQVKDSVNKILHSTTQVDIQNDKEFQKLGNQIKDSINQFLQKGKVTNVYITDLVVQ